MKTKSLPTAQSLHVILMNDEKEKRSITMKTNKSGRINNARLRAPLLFHSQTRSHEAGTAQVFQVFPAVPQ